MITNNNASPLTEDDVAQMARQLLADVNHREVDQFTFRGAQFDRGLAWVHFPEGKGGLGLQPRYQAIVNQVLREGGVTYLDILINTIAIGMVAPTLLEYATEDDQHRYLRPIFTGEHVWCQMFSEPGHGSDLAAVSSRAVRDGDEWVINGQKVWTTLAHIARYGLIVVRTDPDVPKHRGLSYFIVDMRSSGIEVRPLIQIGGEAEFNEVFLTDVRIPDSNRLGAVGDGWRVSVTTLMNERVMLGGGTGGKKGSGAIKVLMRVWNTRRDELGPIERTIWRQKVTDLWIRAELYRLNAIRARANASSGKPGPEGSLAKLVFGELNQDTFEAALDLLGAEGMLHEEGYTIERVESMLNIGSRSASTEFLRARGNSIEGGTTEIQRNIIGERVLRLPADIQVDRDVPWSQVPRS